MLVLAASCSKGEIGHDPSDRDDAISFKTQDLKADWSAKNTTRGTAVDDVDSLSEIMVYAFLSEPGHAAECYIDHKAAIQTNGMWSFSPAYYYPVDQSLDFLAYTPKANATSGADNNGIMQSLDFENKAIKITYSAPLVGRNHPDLMFSNPIFGRNRDTPLDELTFSHALTQVSMSAKVGSDTEKGRYVITRFTMHNITTAAELSYSIDRGIGSWIETSRGDFITSAMLPDPAIDGETQVKLTDKYQSIMSNGHTLFMIPQQIENKEGTLPTIQITVYDSFQGSELTFRTDELELRSPEGQGWKAGQHINLQFTFDVDDENLVIPMTLTAKLLDWVEQQVDKDIDANIYSFLDKSSVDILETSLTLYTNGIAKDIVADGVIIGSASLGNADSNGYYPITIATKGAGVGSITVVLENSHQTTITKTFNIIVE